AAENRSVLGEIPIIDKSNEITAVPDMLEILELTGTIRLLAHFHPRDPRTRQARPERFRQHIKLVARGLKRRMSSPAPAVPIALPDGGSLSAYLIGSCSQRGPRGVGSASPPFRSC